MAVPSFLSHTVWPEHYVGLFTWKNSWQGESGWKNQALKLSWQTYQINSPKINEQCYHFIKTNTTLVYRINNLPLSHVIWYSFWNSLEEECIHFIINNWWLYNTFDHKAFQRPCCVPFIVTKILTLKSRKEWGISLIVWANWKQMTGFSQMKGQLYSDAIFAHYLLETNRHSWCVTPYNWSAITELTNSHRKICYWSWFFNSGASVLEFFVHKLPFLWNFMQKPNSLNQFLPPTRDKKNPTKNSANKQTKPNQNRGEMQHLSAL